MLTREAIRGSKDRMDVCMDGWTDGWVEKQMTEYMTDRHLKMKNRLMANGYFCFLISLLWRIVLQHCLPTPGIRAASTAVHSHIICNWHKIYEVQLTHIIINLTELQASLAERSCLALINNVRLCCWQHRCIRCWEINEAYVYSFVWDLNEYIIMYYISPVCLILLPNWVQMCVCIQVHESLIRRFNFIDPLWGNCHYSNRAEFEIIVIDYGINRDSTE